VEAGATTVYDADIAISPLLTAIYRRLPLFTAIYRHLPIEIFRAEHLSGGCLL
jgi:hypothetical protein